MSKVYLLLLLLVLQTSLRADDNSVLLTIEGTTVTVGEFKRVYEKNNFDNSADYSEKSLKEYLDLFIQFRLKLLDAEKMGIVNRISVKDEFNTYAQQLYNNYFDKKNTHQLVLDMYEKTQQDVAISHIFIKASNNSTDDLKKINDLYKKLKSGEKFEDLAVKFSDDNYSASNGGFLGYFTGMQISLPELEDAAFNTPVGTYTEPFKTSAGYHILRVDEKRPAVGKIKVAIIKKSKIQGNDEHNEKMKENIFGLYDSLNSGKDFSELAKKYSDDVYSKEKGGEIEWFGISTYAMEFEKVAFSLEKEGEYSKPFDTKYAWYIIKKIEQIPPPALDDVYNTIKNQVYKSQRFEMEKDKHIQSILDKYGYQEISPVFENLKNSIISKIKDEEKVVFVEKQAPQEVLTIGGKSIDENELGSYINKFITRTFKKTPEEKFSQIFKEFVQEKAISFHKEKLGDEDEEYGRLLNEYYEGIVLFEVMSSNVWNKAIEDTSGLRKYFESNRKQYLWDEKAEIHVYKMSPKVLKYFNKQVVLKPLLSDGVFDKNISKKGIIYGDEVSFEIQRSEIEKYGLEWKSNSYTTKEEDGIITAYLVNKIIPRKEKTLQEARGFVIADYQKYLEKEWINRLLQEYEINVDPEVFKSLIKE